MPRRPQCLDARRASALRKRALPLVACLAIALGGAASTGCATRTSEDRVINRYGLDVHLLSERKLFGSAIDRGYAHPSDISLERLEIILGSLEIERRERARSVRGPAIPAEVLATVCEGLAEAFREADSSQQISLMAERKQKQKGVFHRKYLTSLIAYIEDDQLVIHLSRSDWPIDEKRTGELPQPHVDDPQQKFRVVTNEFVTRSGETGVAVDWKSDVFGSFAAATAIRTAPVAAASASPSSMGKTTVLEAEPTLPEPEPLTNAQLQSLSPGDLRELADLEEARSAGSVTESEYRRNRQTIIDAAMAD